MSYLIVGRELILAVFTRDLFVTSLKYYEHVFIYIDICLKKGKKILICCKKRTCVSLVRQTTMAQEHFIHDHRVNDKPYIFFTQTRDKSSKLKIMMLFNNPAPTLWISFSILTTIYYLLFLA